MVKNFKKFKKVTPQGNVSTITKWKSRKRRQSGVKKVTRNKGKGKWGTVSSTHTTQWRQ